MSDFRKYLNVYDFDVVLPGSGEIIKFKPITTGQMKKLLTVENTDNPEVIENALDELISSSIITEGFNIKDLYIQDRFFLLVELRKKTKGNAYQFNIKCPDCSSQSIVNIDLNSLNIKKRPEDINHVIKLNDDISIEMDYIKRYDNQIAFNEINKRLDFNDIQKQVESIIYTYATVMRKVITPDGENEISFIDALFLLNNIKQSEYEKIVKWYNDNDFGLDFTYTINCPHCKYSKVESIPVDNFFF